MPDYANGKIYKIVGEDGSVYYGSTTTSLKLRKKRHRYYKGTSAYQKIISQMDWKMILIENYPCESKKELEAREGWYIRENPCVNRVVAGRTKKEYYSDHREEALANRKKYYVENRERINVGQRKHYQDNREQRLESSKKYNEDNREKRNTYNKIRFAWLCSFGDPRKTNCLQRCDPSLFQ